LPAEEHTGAVSISRPYYGFPDEQYKIKYIADGAPLIAGEIKRIVRSVTETSD